MLFYVGQAGLADGVTIEQRPELSYTSSNGTPRAKASRLCYLACLRSGKEASMAVAE